MHNIDYLKDKFFSRFGNIRASKEEKDRMFRQFLYEEEMREMQERQLAESYMGGGIQASSATTTTTTTLPPVYTFNLYNCPGDPYIAYSLSSVYAPGIYIFQDPGLSIPYTDLYQGLGLGTDGIFVYSVVNGLVLPNPSICN
jgi:hypothetical protein